MSVRSDILCLIWINLYYTWSYAEIDKMHRFYPIFVYFRYSESNSNDHLHTDFVQTKFNMDTICLDDHHQFFLAADWSLGSMCRGLAVSNSQLTRVLDSHCLKVCDDTPFVATLSTLNNPQDLDPDY